MRLNVPDPTPADYPERALGHPILERFLDDDTEDDIEELVRIAGLGERRDRRHGAWDDE